MPFHVRAGKSLPVTATEVRVRFKPTGRGALSSEAEPPDRDHYRFEISPDVVIALGVSEASWRIVDPIPGNRTPVFEYEPDTRGPAEAVRLTPAGGWRDPGARV